MMSKVIGLIFVVVVVDGTSNLLTARMTPKIITPTLPFHGRMTTTKGNKSASTSKSAPPIFCYFCGSQSSGCPEPFSSRMRDIPAYASFTEWCVVSIDDDDDGQSAIVLLCRKSVNRQRQVLSVVELLSLGNVVNRVVRLHSTPL